MNLTVVYTTARKEPHLQWFFDSLRNQIGSRQVSVIVVDFAYPFILPAEDWKQIHDHGYFPDRYTGVSPKPTVWQGPYRLTKEDWWAKSNALNTGICLCQTDWIAFVDDRSVLMPGWLNCIQDAMNANYAVCGSYEKHLNLKVENGVIVDEGIVDSRDARRQADYPQPTRDWYGGSGALPLEWCLAVNGFSERLCDGLGSEDSCFGINLRNSGFPMMYDSRMRIIEDRTQGEVDGALRRTDKGQSPQDKSHKIIAIMHDKTTSQNAFDIRELRNRVLSGEPFPPPVDGPLDWFDGQPIHEM